jgi:hypothetical protein
VPYASEFWTAIHPFHLGSFAAAIPQSEEDMEFGWEYLRAGCASDIFEEVCAEEVTEIVQAGRMVSFGFHGLARRRIGAEGRFVINFARQSRH